jgi:hypothetical protein
MTDHVRELRQAAKVLRHLVDHLPEDMQTPIWRVVGTDSESFDGVIIDGTDGDDGWLIETHHERVAAYVAAMRPAVASALILWLEDAATVVEEFAAEFAGSVRDGDLTPGDRAAIATARAVLGVLEP